MVGTLRRGTVAGDVSLFSLLDIEKKRIQRPLKNKRSRSAAEHL